MKLVDSIGRETRQVKLTGRQRRLKHSSSSTMSESEVIQSIEQFIAENHEGTQPSVLLFTPSIQ